MGAGGSVVGVVGSGGGGLDTWSVDDVCDFVRSENVDGKAVVRLHREAQAREAAVASKSRHSDELDLLPRELNEFKPLLAEDALAEAVGGLADLSELAALEGGEMEALNKRLEGPRLAIEAAIEARLREPNLVPFCDGVIRAGNEAFMGVYGAVWLFVAKTEQEGAYEYHQALSKMQQHGTLCKQRSTSVAEVLCAAAAAKPRYDGLMRSVAEEAGGEWQPCKKLKSVARILEKCALKREHGNGTNMDASGVCDVVRGMIVAKSLSGVARVVAALSAKEAAGDLTIVRVKERFFDSPSAGGWRDLMVNLRVDDDHVCEVQVVHASLLAARTNLPGHAIYARLRNAAELLEKLGLDANRRHESLRLMRLKGSPTAATLLFLGCNRADLREAGFDVQEAAAATSSVVTSSVTSLMMVAESRLMGSRRSLLYANARELRIEAVEAARAAIRRLSQEHDDVILGVRTRRLLAEALVFSVEECYAAVPGKMGGPQPRYVSVSSEDYDEGIALVREALRLLPKSTTNGQQLEEEEELLLQLKAKGADPVILKLLLQQFLRKRATWVGRAGCAGCSPAFDSAFKEAAALLGEVVETDPENEVAFIELARLHFETADFRASAAHHAALMRRASAKFGEDSTELLQLRSMLHIAPVAGGLGGVDKRGTFLASVIFNFLCCPGPVGYALAVPALLAYNLSHHKCRPHTGFSAMVCSRVNMCVCCPLAADVLCNLDCKGHVRLGAISPAAASSSSKPRRKMGQVADLPNNSSSSRQHPAGSAMITPLLPAPTHNHHDAPPAAMHMNSRSR